MGNCIEFSVQISAENRTEEDIDLMARQLLFELKETDVESAELVGEGIAPSGTKSADPVIVGNIIVVVLPAVLPKVLDFIQAWATRGQGRIVKFKGRGIEFEGSPEEFQKLLEKLEKANKNERKIRSHCR